MFNKSRMTISKLLRPESIAKIEALDALGVRLEAKRCKLVRHPELERRVYEAVGLGHRLTSKAEIFSKAQDIACELNIRDFDGNTNWCLRFIQQHDLCVASPKAAKLPLFSMQRTPEMPPRKLGCISSPPKPQTAIDVYSPSLIVQQDYQQQAVRQEQDDATTADMPLKSTSDYDDRDESERKFWMQHDSFLRLCSDGDGKVRQPSNVSAVAWHAVARDVFTGTPQLIKRQDFYDSTPTARDYYHSYLLA